MACRTTGPSVIVIYSHQFDKAAIGISKADLLYAA
jgi:hypothetical protein